VIDGDTVRICGVSIRLDDYDAPELHHARCEREYRLALDAKHELQRLAPKLRLTGCHVPPATTAVSVL
jgi:endonuclease YncB( thermonuclease family)